MRFVNICDAILLIVCGILSFGTIDLSSVIAGTYVMYVIQSLPLPLFSMFSS